MIPGASEEWDEKESQSIGSAEQKANIIMSQLTRIE